MEVTKTNSHAAKNYSLLSDITQLFAKYDKDLDKQSSDILHEELKVATIRHKMRKLFKVKPETITNGNFKSKFKQMTHNTLINLYGATGFILFRKLEKSNKLRLSKLRHISSTYNLYSVNEAYFENATTYGKDYELSFDDMMAVMNSQVKDINFVVILKGPVETTTLQYFTKSDIIDVCSINEKMDILVNTGISNHCHFYEKDILKIYLIY